MNKLQEIQSILDENKEQIGDENYLKICNLSLEMANELEEELVKDFYKITFIRSEIVMKHKDHYKVCLGQHSQILHLNKQLATDAIAYVRDNRLNSMPIRTISNSLDTSPFTYSDEGDCFMIDLYIDNSVKITNIERVDTQ